MSAALGTRGVPAPRPEPAPHLSPERLARLRAELEQLRAFRADQLVQLARPDGGPFSSGDSEVAQALRAGARAAFFAVQKALWCIEEGTYGRCTECATQIAEDELVAVPHAARCLRCRQAEYAG